MDIQVEKIEIMKMILDTKNPVILSQIKNIFRDENEEDYWDTLTTEQQNEIKSGIEELDRGEKFSYDEVTKKYR